MTAKKPHENIRDAINKRSRKAMIQSGAKIGKLSDTEKTPPSKRKSDSMKKKLRNRDGKKQPFDFKEPEVLK